MTKVVPHVEPISSDSESEGSEKESTTSKKAYGLQVFIVMVFALTVLTTGVVIWYALFYSISHIPRLIGFLTAKQAAFEIGQVAQKYYVKELSTYSKSYLERIPRLVQQMKQQYALEGEQFLTNTIAQRKYMKAILDTSPHVSGIYFASAQGDMNSLQIVDGTILTGVVANNVLNTYTVDITTLQTINLVSTSSYVPSAQAWYTTSLTANNTAWNNITVVGNNVTVMCSIAYRNASTKAVIGVLNVQLSLTGLSDYLAARDTSSRQFIVDRQGYIVATSNGEVSTTINETINRVLATQQSSVGVKESVKEAIRLYGELASITDTKYFYYFDSNNKYWSVEFSCIEDGSLSWIVFTAMPYQQVFKVVTDGSLYSIIGTVLAVFVSVVIATVIGCCISRSLNDHGYAKRLVTPESPELHELKPYGDTQGISPLNTSPESQSSASLVLQGSLTSKKVTILDVNLGNIQAISETLDSSKMSLLLTEFLDEMSTVVLEAGGMVDRLNGYGFVAFWNVHQDSSNMEIEAVQCAQNMRQQCGYFSKRWSIQPIKLRIGVNTGFCLTGHVSGNGNVNATALGENVDMTAKLRDLCDRFGTELVIGQQTYRAIQEKFACRWLDFIPVSAKDRHMEMYEVICPIVEATEKELHLCRTHDFMRMALATQRYSEVKDIINELVTSNPNNKAALALRSRLERHPAVALTSAWSM